MKSKLLTGKQLKALQCLLIYPTRQEAAAAAGVSLPTLRKYLADDTFQKEYRRAVTELVDDATRQMQGSLSVAIKRLRTILEDDRENSNSHVMAARTVLEYGLKMTEFNDILSVMESTNVL